MKKSSLNKSLKSQTIIMTELERGCELQSKILRYFVYDDAQSVFEIMTKQNDPRNFAVVMKALTAYNPATATRWLDLLIEPFNDIVLSGFTYVSAKVTPEYIKGFILGIFESVVYLDQRFFKPSKEDEPFKNTIMRFVDFFMFGNSISYCLDDYLPDKKFEGHLSNAIKAFLRGNLEAQEKRYDFAVDFINNVLEKSKLFKDGVVPEERKLLSKIGEIILNQFTIPTIIEGTSPIGRAKMVCDLFKKK